jgi:hypothetical protein
MTTDRWWRRNRAALAALPIVVAAALAASSNRVEDRWWLAEARDLLQADQGSWAHLEASQYDRTGDVPFEVRIRLDDVRRTDQPFGDGELTVPTGAAAIAVDLSLAADPDTPLTACQLFLRDDDGTEYAYQSSAPSISQPSSPCVPPDTPGPELDLFEGMDPEQTPPRPPEWTVSPVVLVPDGVDVTEVVITWGPPDGVVLNVSPVPS